MEQIVQVQDGVGSSLVALGDGNWKMGEGMRAAANKGPKLGEGSEHILIEHYICKSRYQPPLI